MDARRYIRVGETKIDDSRTVIYEINKETEKAIQVRQVVKFTTRTGKTGQVAREAWLPKSQITICQDFIAMKPWLAETKGLNNMSFSCMLGGKELKEQLGWDLANLTAEQELQLYAKGLSKVSWDLYL